VRAGALLLLLTAAGAQERSYEDEIAAGRSALEAGRFDEALVSFQRASALRPDDWRSHTYRSLTLIQIAQGTADPHEREARLMGAERVAGDLVKQGIVEFHDPLYRFLRGLVLSVSGQYGKAYDILTQALRAPQEKFDRYEEIDLQASLQRARSVSAIQVAVLLIARGKFEEAENLLKIAVAGLPKGDPEWARLHRVYAAVSENLDRIDEAIGHLRSCLELSKDIPEAVDELTATIALVYLNHEETEKARAVLSEARKDSEQPDLVLARASLVAKDALRERGARLDEAMAYVKEAMSSCPPERRYWLVLVYRNLLLSKVGPNEAQTPEGRALIEEALAIFLKEIERRPECPPLYFAVYRCYKLLGNTEEELRYQDLHATRKREFRSMDQYDYRGWPRCGS